MTTSPLIDADAVLMAKSWPDGLDVTITLIYLAIVLGVPLLGYVLMALDYRAYLRSLRRALVLVARTLPTTPYWALRDRPPCLEALELHQPITESDVISAYRQRVKQLHPDRGGDLCKFLRLQQHFEQALNLVRQQPKYHADSTR